MTRASDAVRKVRCPRVSPPASLIVHRGIDASTNDDLAIEEAAFAHIVLTHDAQQGVAAFVEKRRPSYQERRSRPADEQMVGGHTEVVWIRYEADFRTTGFQRTLKMSASG